jgi:hypothetical protein
MMTLLLPPASGRYSALFSALVLRIQAAVDLRNLFDPLPTLGVLQRHDLGVRPMEVKGDIRYLLVEPL